MSADARRAKMVVGGGAVGSFLLLVIGWFGLISPSLSDADSTRAQTQDTALQNTVLVGKIGKLKAASENMSGLTKQLAAAREALPVRHSLDAFTDELVAYAKKTKIELTGISAATPAPVVATAPQPGKAASAAGALYSVTVTILSSGAGAGQAEFLRQIQYGPRAVLVSSTKFTPAASSGVKTFDTSTTMTTVLQVYVAPQSPEAMAELLKQLGKQPG
jgi:hypothetical protein